MHRLQLFGGASVITPSGPLSGRAVQRRRLALLALLVGARDRGLTRDKLIAYLWPDSDAERARHLLSDSIYRINQALGGEALTVAGDVLRLDPERLPSDAWEFGDAIANGDWQRAVELYTAPFLDGFFLTGADEFERWAEAERDNCRRERARALEMLADEAEARGDQTAALRWWRALALDDPYSSRIALRLMAALESAGERAAAVQHARIHAVLLHEDLGVEADREVAAYAERLRAAGTARSAARAPTSSSANGPIPVDQPPADEQPAGAVPALSASLPVPRPKRRQVVLVVAAALLAVVVLVWVARRPGEARPPPGTTAVAVLPFEDLSAAGDEEYFADGITEELIVKLSKLDGLRVVGRTSVFALKGQSADVREIGARLGVNAVLAGSVRKADDRLRITAQLMDATDGYQLWSDTYERQIADVFEIQDEISRAIVMRLRGRLAGIDSAWLATPSTEDPEAYNLYLKGRFAWHKRTEEGLRDAVSFFRQAVERAPAYARAHAGLGDAYAVLGFYDYLPPAEAFPRAAQAATTAVQLDATLAEAHATIAYVALYYDWNWQRSETEFRRTINLDPGYSTGRQWYANFLTAMGRFEEAEREMRAATELDPLSLIANAALGWVLYHAGAYERALDQLGRALDLNSDFELAYLWRGLTLEEMGRLDEAIVNLEHAVELSGGTGISRSALARAYALKGDTALARSMLRQLQDSGENHYVPSYEIGKVHEALGDRSNALLWLERAFRQRSHSMVFLAVDPQLKKLRDHPAFARLLREVGLPPRPGA